MPLTSVAVRTSPPHHTIGTYAESVFSSLHRADQRRWAETYLHGILFADGKKSVRGIADSVGIFRANQSLQQFINQSPWKWEPVRRLIAQHLQAVRPTQAWVVHRVVIPKRGQRSVGVQRRFVPELGRSVNSQLILAVSLADEHTAVPVDWRIALGGDWCTDEALRQAAYIPDAVRGRTEGAEIMDMIDEMRSAWRLEPAPITGDIRHFPDAARLVGRLVHLGATFSLQVDGGFPLAGAGRLQALMHTRTACHGAERDAPTVRRLLDQQVQHPAGSVFDGPPGEGAVGRGGPSCRVRIVSALARPNVPRSGLQVHPRPLKVIGEVHQDGSTRYWVTNMLKHSIDDILAVNGVGLRGWRDPGVPESEFGLRDFEGRSYRGLHHHLTMVSAAFAFNALDGGYGLGRVGEDEG
ncbi:transposase [Actinospica sp. MGRD01-02]|uniref:Transposase n=1 Tax=Actinospica acidithermotolerans TaxID=2828514 RepID=A0A941IQ55_9ACTN|nr:transposase [Actinospica acidithermotolerans]MBR7831086.1 transposase [Actinospica acidithermotolerans]